MDSLALTDRAPTSRRRKKSSTSGSKPTTPSRLLLLDHSAWSRLLADQVPPHRENDVLDWIANGRLATCLPFLLEAGFSARTPRNTAKGWGVSAD